MDYLASEENCNIDYKINRKITIGHKKEVEGIYIFDLTGQHSVDSPPKKSRKYLATCKVGFKSDKK